MEHDLIGKVFLVTGATEGIGKAAARDFARRGATLVLVGRNPAKTAQVKAEIAAEGGPAPVETIVGDLALLAEVRRVAAEFRARHDRLDVLVNNAGAVFDQRQVTAEGIEMTFALNHLGHFLLTHEVRGLLEQTPGARVVSTSSGAHRMGNFDFDDLVKREKVYGSFQVYGDSKLANILFTRELARRLQPAGVVANCFHPGMVQTGFALNGRGLTYLMVKLSYWAIARTPEQGAETLIWLATSPEAATKSGEYFYNCRVARTSKVAKDPALAARLWGLSEQLCGLQ
ncbi:MAG: SDR family oxidoreductase [Deltaproteobacteria bacterium]|nr:SDR family oxidoreductase [Deltaproteobacteria bacterium]